MTGGDYINLKTLSLEELAGVVNLYPWFGSARKELCKRMSKMGQETWDKEQYADAAMYICDRKMIADIFRAGKEVDFSDADLEELLHGLLPQQGQPAEAPAQGGYQRTVRVVGGDYFTQAQYDDVSHTEDNVFSRFAVKASLEDSKEKDKAPKVKIDDDFCTEPMAQIYAEQGYLEQAKHIYSRLLLKFPEKSAYFAALIERLN